MFTRYDTTDFSELKTQHNIMVLVGNGFDIKLLKQYEKHGLVSSYEKFYDYLRYKCTNVENNILFQRMTESRAAGYSNWSDFENCLGELLKESSKPMEALEKDLFRFQTYFSMFLNELVTPELLEKMGERVSRNEWAITSLSKFLEDLPEEEYDRLKFPLGTAHYDLFNFFFVNFNYTALLDNYIYLDKKQFDPHKYKTVDTNFGFWPNPNGYPKEGINAKTCWSAYVMTEIVHPHGLQAVPRSMLFGVDSGELQREQEKKFAKPYWARAEQRYGRFFRDARLFVIYGASLGGTDRWWWKNIFQRLKTGEAELIIYDYDEQGKGDRETVKDRFLKACGHLEEDREALDKVREKIFVVKFNGKRDTALFQLRERWEIRR